MDDINVYDEEDNKGEDEVDAEEALDAVSLDLTMSKKYSSVATFADPELQELMPKSPILRNSSRASLVNRRQRPSLM
jgi:hypothetical protein